MRTYTDRASTRAVLAVIALAFSVLVVLFGVLGRLWMRWERLLWRVKIRVFG
jgi:hypothetical protein